MSDTPRMGLPLIEAAQAQKHVTHNEALVILDCLAHLFLQDRDLADPPGTPGEGEAWLIASPASGDWAGQEGRIAVFIDNDWRFFIPFKGLGAYVGDEQTIITHDGSEWSDFAALIAPQNLPMLGVGTTADSVNPFAVRLNNALFTALDVAGGGDGDIRLKVNKETAAGTASFLFQSNWSGRAEIGLCGDEDFHFKVSPDGSQWTDALTIDAATGALAAQGNALWHGGNDGPGSGLDADLLDGNEAAALANPPAASQAEAETGTETELRSFSPQRLSQAIAALGGGGTLVHALQRDIRLLALKQAADDGDRANMADGIADPLDDFSDIDTGISTNIDIGTLGWITPTVDEEKQGGTPNSLSSGSFTFLDRSFSLDNGKTVTHIAVYSATARGFTVKIGKRNSAGNYDIVVSEAMTHGGTGWEYHEISSPYAIPASGDFYVGAWTNGTGNRDLTTNSITVAYIATTDITGAGVVMTEGTSTCWLTGARYAISDMDCRSQAFTAASAPDTGRLHFQVAGADAGTLTLNTDLIGYCSRDGGTSWTAATLTEVMTLAAGTRIFEDAGIDISGQPSGTDMKWRLVTANGVDVALHGVVQQWM